MSHLGGFALESTSEMQSVQNAQLPTFSRVTLFPVKSPIKVAQRTLLLSLSGLRAGSRGRMGRTISMRFPVCSPLDKLPSMCPFLYVLHLSHKDSSVHSNSTLAFSLFNAPNLRNESDPPNSLFCQDTKHRPLGRPQLGYPRLGV